MNPWRRLAIRIGLVLLAGCPAMHACSALAASLFDSTTLLEIRLSGPISTTIRDRRGREERDFLLDLGGIEHAVRVRVRGRSRARRDVCIFPPLRLRFADTEELFDGQRKIRMVTHCRNSDAGEANAMEEYLAYRILNLLTPDAFRVRPLLVTYVDSEGRLSRRARQRHGFFIESRGELGRRRGGSFVQQAQLSLRQLDSQHAALVYVFQYLIGNTDWSLVTAEGDSACCHNGRLLKVGDRIRYVPYDFDLAGLVNASYAEPDPRLHLRSVRTRRYRGFCTDRSILRSALRTVMDREADIYTLLRGVSGLDDRAKKAASAYLADFFQEARSEDALLSAFEERCLSAGS